MRGDCFFAPRRARIPARRRPAPSLGPRGLRVKRTETHGDVSITNSCPRHVAPLGVSHRSPDSGQTAAMTRRGLLRLGEGRGREKKHARGSVRSRGTSGRTSHLTLSRLFAFLGSRTSASLLPVTVDAKNRSSTSREAPTSPRTRRPVQLTLGHLVLIPLTSRT